MEMRGGENVATDLSNDLAPDNHLCIIQNNADVLTNR